MTAVDAVQLGKILNALSGMAGSVTLEDGTVTAAGATPEGKNPYRITAEADVTGGTASRELDVLRPAFRDLFPTARDRKDRSFELPATLVATAHPSVDPAAEAPSARFEAEPLRAAVKLLSTMRSSRWKMSWNVVFLPEPGRAKLVSTDRFVLVSTDVPADFTDDHDGAMFEVDSRVLQTVLALAPKDAEVTIARLDDDSCWIDAGTVRAHVTSSALAEEGISRAGIEKIAAATPEGAPVSLEDVTDRCANVAAKILGMRDLTGYVQQGRMAAFIGDNVVVKGVRRKA